MAGMYTPIWERIKKEKCVKIELPVELFKRVKKAVIKEKDKDQAFKIKTEQMGVVPDKMVLVITEDTEHKQMKFELKARLGI